MKEIQDILRQLGIGRNYRGYQCAVLCVERVLENDTRLCALSREVLVPVAQTMHATREQTERNLRTVVQRAWLVNPELIVRMAGYPFHHAPTLSEFLEIVSSYLLRTSGEGFDKSSNGCS